MRLPTFLFRALLESAGRVSQVQLTLQPANVPVRSSSSAVLLVTLQRVCNALLTTLVISNVTKALTMLPQALGLGLASATQPGTSEAPRPKVHSYCRIFLL